jgi:hypothetical protein
LFFMFLFAGILTLAIFEKEKVEDEKWEMKGFDE